MNNGAIFGVTFRMRDIPFDGCSGDKYLPRGGARFAQSIVGRSNTQASAGELIAKLWVEIRLNDKDALPIATEFLSDNHRERRSNALAHLGLAAPDVHFAAC